MVERDEVRPGSLISPVRKLGTPKSIGARASGSDHPSRVSPIFFIFKVEQEMYFDGNTLNQ
jgi:hypothetical protein